MKHFYLIIFQLIGFFLFSQNQTFTLAELDSLTNQTDIKEKVSFVVFPECEIAQDKRKCFANKLQDFIVKNIGNNAKEFLNVKYGADTLVLYASLHYNKLGLKSLDYSKLRSSFSEFDKFLEPIKNTLPRVKPALNEDGNPISKNVNLSLGFIFDKNNNSLSPLYEYSLEEAFFQITENVPVHPNCNEDADNSSIKACMSYNIQSFISNNFNINVLKNVNLADGHYRVFMTFKIDENGNIIDAKARGPHKLIEEEAKRVVQLLPRFKPGMIRGKPVVVPYSVPIVFQVENKQGKKN